jgi:hypothetical protein
MLSRAVLMLGEVTEEELLEYSVLGPKYSESTIRKDKWVMVMYDQFCVKTQIPKWPYDLVNLVQFIKYLGKRCIFNLFILYYVYLFFLGYKVKYAIGSIEYIIVPGLKRHWRNAMNERTIPKDMADTMYRALKDIKKKLNYVEGSQGMEPILYYDVELLVENMPKDLPTREEEISLYLFALYTGGRCVTCDNIYISDIVNITQKPDDPKHFLQFLLRVTKGNSNWNHAITLHGSLTVESNMDPVFWFNAHLKKCFGLDLANFRNWDRRNLKVKLWRWSGNSMSHMIKARMEYTGYPNFKNFAFHSFRSGFLCSAIIKAGNYILG